MEDFNETVNVTSEEYFEGFEEFITLTNKRKWETENVRYFNGYSFDILKGFDCTHYSEYVLSEVMDILADPIHGFDIEFEGLSWDEKKSKLWIECKEHSFELYKSDILKAWDRYQNCILKEDFADIALARWLQAVHNLG